MLLQYGGNAPRVLVKVNRPIHDWPAKVFQKEGARYLAESGDGRATCHYHSGAIGMDKVKRFRTPDGELHAQYPSLGIMERVDGEWVEVERLCTTKQDGYGGSHYPITLDDGRELILRGPWHGGPPPGYVDVTIIDTSPDYYSRWRAGRPWYQAGGTFGTYLSENLYMRIMARFAPHLRIAKVDIGSGPMLEPYLEEWGEPKQFWQKRFHKPGGQPHPVKG